MTRKAVFREEFDEFVDDPGIQIRPGGMEKVALGDIYVFPDLEVLSPGKEEAASARGGKLSSSRLLDLTAAGGGALILGSEDSGKTSLLKVFARRLLDTGFFPLYADGKTLRIPRSEDTDEFFLASYRSLYVSGSSETIEGEPREKRVLLLDNADMVAAGSGELGSFLAGLNIRFGAVILTASNPVEYSELPPGFSVFGVPEGYAVFGIRELGHDLREGLVSKWIIAGGPEGENEAERRKERLRGAVDNVLERNLVPSYPVFILTILQMADSEEPEGPSGSSYGQYYEYLIMKSLKGMTGRENFTIFTAFLSELAYKMFSRRSRWISGEDVLALFDAEAGESKNLPGWPQGAVSGLLNADILSGKESGYEFRHGYIYHYFAAFYFSSNLRKESVREEVKRLAGGLEVEENANIMLFLTYLSGDPFPLEQIARNVEYAAAAGETYAKEEEEQYLDELISELEKLIDKDRRLKEARAEYLQAVETPESKPIGFRTNGADIRVKRRKEARGPGSLRRARLIDALLRISSEALRSGTAKDRHDALPGFGDNLLILWSASFRRGKREADRARESFQGMEGHAFGRSGTAEELLYMNALRGLYLRIYMRSVRQLSMLGYAARPAGGGDIPDDLMTLCSGLLRKDPAPGSDAVGAFLKGNPKRKFARELLRECAFHRTYLFGEDEYSREMDKLFGSGKVPESRGCQ